MDSPFASGAEIAFMSTSRCIYIGPIRPKSPLATAMMLLPDSGVAALFEYEGVPLEGPLDLGQDERPHIAARSGRGFSMN